METALPAGHQSLEALRRRRAELRESLLALEQALAAPAPGRADAWAQRVHVALVELSADFRAHVHVTEGPDGLYAGLLATALRLSHAVEHLTRDHDEIRAMIDEATSSASRVPTEGDVDRIRDCATALLARLLRHRQRGADLVYEAYEADVGGEA